MADFNLTSAAELYRRAASRITGDTPVGIQQPQVAPSQEFSAVLRDSVQQAAEVQKVGEQMSMKAIANEADLAEVVAAVNNADLTLQTVVTIRDRVIQAYQEIIRMPI